MSWGLEKHGLGFSIILNCVVEAHELGIGAVIAIRFS